MSEKGTTLLLHGGASGVHEVHDEVYNDDKGDTNGDDLRELLGVLELLDHIVGVVPAVIWPQAKDERGAKANHRAAGEGRLHVGGQHMRATVAQKVQATKHNQHHRPQPVVQCMAT